MIQVVQQSNLWRRVQDVIGIEKQTGGLNVQLQGTMLGYRWSKFIWIAWAPCPNRLQVTPTFWLWWTSLRKGWNASHCHPKQRKWLQGQQWMSFFARFGYPFQIFTDQGRNFESRHFKSIWEILQIHKSCTTPYRPSAKGHVERFNRTLMDAVRCFVDKSHRTTGMNTYHN